MMSQTIRENLKEDQIIRAVAQYTQAMIKLYVEIGFLNVKFDRCIERSHFLLFVLENQENDIMQFDQAFLYQKQKKKQLDKLHPLRAHLIVSAQKSGIFPFHLFLKQKIGEQIKIKIPINQEVILKHYFRHQIFQDISPIEQIYRFQGGEITYWVHITKAMKILDPVQILVFGKEFNHKNSIKSYSDQNSEMTSTIKETGLTYEMTTPKSQKQNIDQRITPEPKYQKKISLMRNFSVQQIADRLEIQSYQHESCGNTSEISNQSYFILGRKNSRDDRILLQSSNFKLKIILVMIILALLLWLIRTFLSWKYFQNKGHDHKIKKSRKYSRQKLKFKKQKKQ